MKILNLFFSLFIGGITVQLAEAQSTWTGANIVTDINWSDAGNWSGGAPANNAVTFPDGAWPVTTNVLGAVNNIVQANTQITSLTYNNNGAANDFDTTLIPSGTTLTVNGNMTAGGAAVAVYASIAGGGSLLAGTNGTSTLLVQSTSGTATLNLSNLNTFVFNSGGAGGPVSLSTGSSSASGTIYLAGISNNITATTLSLGNNNTGGTGIMNLGNGTNIVNADTISMGMDKTAGTMQFLNNAGGGLKIASHTGTGRATINLGSVASSGSSSANTVASMLFNGGTVNILAGTMTVGNRGNRTVSGGNGSNRGILSFNNGVVDATTIKMAINSAGAPGFGTISVGGGTLKIGSGGLSLVSSSGAGVGAGALIVTNGGTVICDNNIFKTTSQGTGTVTMVSGNLTMSSLGGTIGVSNGIPIDNFNITNSTLTLPVATPPTVATVNFNPDATTQNTINISSLPIISTYPQQFPIISYQIPGGNLNSFVLGTLPPASPSFQGYISNNVANLSIDLVITNGPLAKADQWGGGINNLWDTTTLNWTNNGIGVTYNDLDLVTFDDSAVTNMVNLTGTRQPATLTINNNVLNYVLTGIGKISGPVQLVMNGSASLTLAESGGDNFSGGIVVNGGTLVLDNTNSAISGGLTIGGGTTVQIGNNDANGALPSGTLDDEGTLAFKRTDNVVVGAGISGGGALVQNGSGKLTLSVSNSYTGNTTVGNGTLALTGSGLISSSAAIAVSNATLDVSGVSAVVTTLNSLDLTNSSLNVKVGYLQTNLTMNSLTMEGTANTINVASLPPIAYYPATVTLLQSFGGITGYNFVLGTLPAASPAYAGTIAQSGDGNSVLLTLTAGPIGVRSSVTWSGVDAVGNVNTNWSDAQNWQSPGVPVAAEKASFNNTATTGGSPFDTLGDGIGGIVNPDNINNIVDVNQTNAALSYANTAGSFHNTLIAPGKTLTVNGAVTVNGSGGNVSILGTNAALIVTNPASASAFNVAATTAPTLDMSGLDSFTATVSQIGVGFNTASAGSSVSGTWYLARTNRITTGGGNFGTSSALVVGGSSGSTAGTGQLYLGQTNAFYVDGIVLGASTSTGDIIQFNPVFSSPVAYIRGITGDSSRVTSWSLGDATANINNAQSGSGFINDFSAGTLNARVGTLIVGQGAQGNMVNLNVKATFTMGAGNLDVTTLNIGVGVNGKVGGTGIGVMNVTGGTVLANSLGLGLGTVTNSSGTLNLAGGATLVVSNGISIGTGTAGGALNISASTVKILNGDTISNTATITLDAGGILDVSALTGGTLTLAGGPTLAGNGTVNGSLVADVGSTVSPGASAGVVGVLTVTNGLTLLGTTVMEVDQGNGTNDVIRGAQTINYGGTLSLTNLSGTLTTNDSFKIFYAAHYNGTFTNLTGSPGDGLAWDPSDLAVNGTIKVTTPAPLKPTITSISLSGTTLNISATNGAINGQYVLLGTTNLATPLNEWTPVLTNNFDSSGNLNLSTNIIDPAVPQEFYLLSQ